MGVCKFRFQGLGFPEALVEGSRDYLRAPLGFYEGYDKGLGCKGLGLLAGSRDLISLEFRAPFKGTTGFFNRVPFKGPYKGLAFTELRFQGT